jgi:type I restriction-modification system DNA methylase subunit
MTDKQMSTAAAAFAERWQGEGYEKGQSQMFWSDLLTKVYGIEDLTSFVRFEEQVKSDISTTNFIDVRIPSTKVFIEQKSINKDLRAPIRQSDGNFLTPFQQVKRYANDVSYSQRPRWIITCNFKEFLVYDMEQPNSEPESILLKDLGTDYYRLKFLVDEKSEHISKEMEVSMAAGEIVGRIYDALLKQYDDNSPEALRWLNILCVRIVFCLYAEDAGIFSRDQFHNYLAKFDAEGMRQALLQLFQTLNTKEGNRSKFLRDDLKAFPYTNGGLFAAEIEIPQFTDELRKVLLHNASLDFDWSKISPTIFGAVFESTLNPETRRSGGMHYTSIENIHKVIDALFLNTLRKEFETILEEKVEKTRNRLLDAFQDKLASLVFFDPACGSGNFLTETYLSLRRLENDVIRARYHGQAFIGFEDNSPIKVSISQFYGIEINDFAVTVTTTALWISEAQMLAETEKIIDFNDDFLPLKTYTNITEGNALRIEWKDVVPVERLSYIIGNPPFVGYSLQSKEQKEDILSVFIDVNGKPFKTAGKIDYVAGWYYKAAELMQHTGIKAALVSTNSICQGEQVAAIWKPLKELFGIHIDFAYRTFRWDSEASDKAAVHCVIVGFSCLDNKGTKYLYEGNKRNEAVNISAYLIDAPDTFIDSRGKSICDVPQMVYGNKPTDGGFLFLSKEEKDAVINKEPEVAKYIKRIYGSVEYINNKERYCLWLVGANPTDLRKSAFIRQRIESVRQFRLSSPKEATRKSADWASLFQEVRQPESNFIIVPRVSSENRRYVPMGFMSPDNIVNDSVQFIPNASLYDYGILTSNVHMAWMRAVCGRLKSDYRYSKDVVYNNFPWPSPTEAQKARIEETAQAILDARALYPDSSLADLYDEVAMPPELRKAHQANDRAVMEAYGFPVSREFTESLCVAELFKLYQDLIK